MPGMVDAKADLQNSSLRRWLNALGLKLIFDFGKPCGLLLLAFPHLFPCPDSVVHPNLLFLLCCLHKAACGPSPDVHGVSINACVPILGQEDIPDVGHPDFFFGLMKFQYLFLFTIYLKS